MFSSSPSEDNTNPYLEVVLELSLSNKNVVEPLSYLKGILIFAKTNFRENSFSREFITAIEILENFGEFRDLAIFYISCLVEYGFS